jgi:hypothetical protein
MARDPDIERKLENWSRWKIGAGLLSGGLGYAAASLGAAAGGGSAGYREAIIPTFDAEAAVTDQAVQALPVTLREAIEATYLRRGGQIAVAAELGIAVRTLHGRIERACYALLGWYQDRAAAMAQERKRVESLISSRQ